MKRPTTILLAVTALLWLIQLFLFRGFVIDDSFITMRYAQHLAEGHGIVWNVGEEPVEGFTSFLWVVVLALPHVIAPGAVEAIARGGGLLAVTGLGVWLFRVLAARSGTFAAAVAVLPLLAGTPFAINSVSGMETGLAILLAGVGHVFAVRGILERDARALTAYQVIALLACLNRPDYALCYIVTIAGGYLAARRVPDRAEWLRGVLFFALPGLVYFVIRWQYFGYLLPNPFYVKSGGGGMKSIIYVGSFLVAFAAPALAALALGLRDPRTRAVSLMTAIAFLVPVLSYLRVNPLMGVYWRFLIPYYAVVPLAVAAALQHRTGWLLRGLVAGQLALSLSMFPLAAQYAERARGFTGVLRTLGTMLHQTDDTGRYLAAMNDVGIVPYLSRWPVVDTVGLCDDAIAHDESTVQERLAETAPDLVLLHDPRARLETYDLTQIGAVYEEVARIPYIRGLAENDIVLWVREDSPVRAPLLEQFEATEWEPGLWSASPVQTVYDAIRSVYHRKPAE